VSQYDGVTPTKSDSRSESLKGYKIVSKNDLVINIMLAWMGGLGVSKYEGIVSPAYCIYKLCDSSNPRFLHFLYKTSLYLAEFARRSSGVIPSRWRMYTDDFGQVLSLLPPRKEQDAIVSYLDSVTSKIDEAIAQQQKMIDLLNERKQIIINDAVTKGLDPKAKMKDSEIDWIGQIPEHWEVRSFKMLMFIQRGHDLTAEKFKSGDVPVYGSGGLMGLHNAKTSKAPSIVIGRSGSVGKLQYIEKDFWAHNTVIYMTENKGNDIKYLFYLLKSVDLSALATQTAVPTLDRKNVLSYKIPCCLDIKEQQKISKYLDERLSEIDEVISSERKKISLLQERKQIIINDVVTGKVKVA
jgi:type I restriction enzyme S subunit